MKALLLFLGAILLATALAAYFMGQAKWHLRRNDLNQLPLGQLRHQSEDLFIDEADFVWELQPAIKNKFHQPGSPVQPIAKPYALVVDTSLPMDVKNPNLKFLCQLENGASYEAILQPDGTFLTEGGKMGTYNYSHPGDIIGIIKHMVWDVLPHFMNADYQ